MGAVGDMADSTDFKELLGRLHAEKAEHESRICDIDDAIRALSKLAGVPVAEIVSEAPQLAAPASETPVPTQRLDPNRIVALSPEVLREACYGKTMADAAIAVLAIKNTPLRETDLVEYLKAGDVPIVSVEPVMALRTALHRKRKEFGVLKEFSRQVWGLAYWPEAVNPNHLGFVARRDKDAHMAASLRGLQDARDQGKRLGRLPTITEEHAPIIAGMMAEGRSYDQIATRLGVSKPGLSKAIRRLRLQGALPFNASAEENPKPQAAPESSDEPGG